MTLCLLCLAVSCAPFSHSAEPAALLDGFPRSQLLITTANDCLLFDIYIAESPRQRAQGLMYVRNMGEREGMLFLYAEAAEISMWMKNTLIPLDMLFLDAGMRVSSIHESAVPLSTAVISSGSPARGVIELNGGAAKRFGIEPGNQVTFPAP